MTGQSPRPAFLNRQHKNGATIVADFKALPKAEAAAVDKWLLINESFGSLTWQETHLFNWINDSDEAEELFA